MGFWKNYKVSQSEPFLQFLYIALVAGTKALDLTVRFKQVVPPFTIPAIDSLSLNSTFILNLSDCSPYEHTLSCSL